MHRRGSQRGGAAGGGGGGRDHASQCFLQENEDWDLDLCYEGLLRPLLRLGMIWDPQFGPREKNEASRRDD